MSYSGTGNYNIRFLQGTVLYQQRCYRATALIQTGFNNNTMGSTVRIGFQFLHFGNQKNGFQQLIQVHTGLSGNRNTDGVTTPLFRNNFMFSQLLHNFIHGSFRLIHFVDSNHNGNFGSFGVVNGFNGLWHDTVVCGNNQNGNISCQCTSGTHFGKGGMARGIQEGNALTVYVYTVCTNGLRNTTGFSGGNGCVTDGVQNRSFTMVNVTHNTDNRIPRKQIFLCIYGIIDNLIFNGNHVFSFYRGTQLFCKNGSGVKINDIVDGGHLAQGEELLNNFSGSHTQFFCKFTNGDFIAHLDNPGLFGAFCLNSLQTLCFGFPFLGANPLLTAVLLGLLLQLLLIAGNPVIGSGFRIQIVILFIIFIQVNVLYTGINRSDFTLGTGLHWTVFRLLCLLLERVRICVYLRLCRSCRLGGRFSSLLFCSRFCCRIGCRLNRSILLLTRNSYLRGALLLTWDNHFRGTFLFTGNNHLRCAFLLTRNNDLRGTFFFTRYYFSRCLFCRSVSFLCRLGHSLRLFGSHCKVSIKIRHLMLLCVVFKYHIQFIIGQGRHMFFGVIKVFCQQIYYLFAWLVKILGNLVYSIFNLHLSVLLRKKLIELCGKAVIVYGKYRRLFSDVYFQVLHTTVQLCQGNAASLITSGFPELLFQTVRGICSQIAGFCFAFCN